MAKVYFIVSAVGSQQSQFSIWPVSWLEFRLLHCMFIAIVIHRSENGRNGFGSPMPHNVSAYCANKAIEDCVVPYKSQTWRVLLYLLWIIFCMSRHILGALVNDHYISFGADIAMIEGCLAISPSLSMGYTI